MKIAFWLTVYPWAAEGQQPSGFFVAEYPPGTPPEGSRVFRVAVEVPDGVTTLQGSVEAVDGSEGGSGSTGGTT